MNVPPLRTSAFAKPAADTSGMLSPFGGERDWGEGSARRYGFGDAIRAQSLEDSLPPTREGDARVATQTVPSPALSISLDSMEKREFFGCGPMVL